MEEPTERLASVRECFKECKLEYLPQVKWQLHQRSYVQHLFDDVYKMRDAAWNYFMYDDVPDVKTIVHQGAEFLDIGNVHSCKPERCVMLFTVMHGHKFVFLCLAGSIFLFPCKVKRAACSPSNCIDAFVNDGTVYFIDPILMQGRIVQRDGLSFDKRREMLCAFKDEFAVDDVFAVPASSALDVFRYKNRLLSTRRHRFVVRDQSRLTVTDEATVDSFCLDEHQSLLDSLLTFLDQKALSSEGGATATDSSITPWSP